MAAIDEVNVELLDDYLERGFGEGGPADDTFLKAGLEKTRRDDVADTFIKFRESVAGLLLKLGIEEPIVIDKITMLVAIQERRGFESGVRHVHDNAHVTSKAEAQRHHSFMNSVKTAGTMGID